jgi:hypothetical protein
MAKTPKARVGRPQRPLGVKLINAVGRWASTLGVQPVSLAEDRLIDQAIRKAGSSDFGGDDFREGLRRFLASAEHEADLTLLGRLMVQGYTVDNLANRLRLVEWRKQHPEIEQEEIVAPWFIVGLPRTGTTILHALLEQDPANRSAPRSKQGWQRSWPKTRATSTARTAMRPRISASIPTATARRFRSTSTTLALPNLASDGSIP